MVKSGAIKIAGPPFFCQDDIIIILCEWTQQSTAPALKIIKTPESQDTVFKIKAPAVGLVSSGNHLTNQITRIYIVWFIQEILTAKYSGVQLKL